MKKNLLVLIVVMILCSTSPAFAAEEVGVYLNGVKIESAAPAVIISGTTMLPFRSIFNALGVDDSKITWDEKSKSIEVRVDKKYLFLAIGSTGALLNDSLITLKAAPYIDKSRTYVPVRVVSEALGADVVWEETSRTVQITKK
ncbi:MAG: copper amine oxidase N-terminal domain-containing protein [Syntrophomonadaceae bacterium]|nr:copper amine oxidase N-terminal domain-containing protein [Syntrophomonadaceae bacterium]